RGDFQQARQGELTGTFLGHMGFDQVGKLLKYRADLLLAQAGGFSDGRGDLGLAHRLGNSLELTRCRSSLGCSLFGGSLGRCLLGSRFLRSSSFLFCSHWIEYPCLVHPRELV